jgi:hypothetical protein
VNRPTNESPYPDTRAPLLCKHGSGRTAPVANVVRFNANSNVLPVPPGFTAIGETSLWHDCQREIIAVAAFVANLEAVAVDRKDRAIGQVSKGA